MVCCPLRAWALWNVRNCFCFEGKQTHPEQNFACVCGLYIYMDTPRLFVWEMPLLFIRFYINEVLSSSQKKKLQLQVPVELLSMLLVLVDTDDISQGFLQRIQFILRKYVYTTFCGITFCHNSEVIGTTHYHIRAVVKAMI